MIDLKPRRQIVWFTVKLLPYEGEISSDIEAYQCDEEENKVLWHVEDIYSFEVSDVMVSDIIDCLLPQIDDWQKCPLDKIYPIVFILV